MLKTLTLAYMGATLADASNLRRVVVASPTAEGRGAFNLPDGPSAVPSAVPSAEQLTFLQKDLHFQDVRDGNQLLARLDKIRAQNADSRAKLEQECVDFDTVFREKRKDTVNILSQKKAAWSSPGAGAWPKIEAAYDKAMKQVRDETLRLLTEQQHAKDDADKRVAAALVAKSYAELHRNELNLAHKAAKSAAVSGIQSAEAAFRTAEAQAEEAEVSISNRAENEIARVLKDAETKQKSEVDACIADYDKHVKALDEEIARAQSIKGPLFKLINRCRGVLSEMEGGDAGSFLEVSTQLLTGSRPEGCVDAHKEYVHEHSLLQIASARHAPSMNSKKNLETQEGNVKGVHDLIAQRYNQWIHEMETARGHADAIKVSCLKNAAHFLESRQAAAAQFKAKEAKAALAEKQKSVRLAEEIKIAAVTLLNKAVEDAQKPLAGAENRARAAGLAYSEELGTAESKAEALTRLKKEREEYTARMEATQKELKDEAIQRKKNDVLIAHSERMAVIETALEAKRMDCNIRQEELDKEIEAIEQIHEKLHAMLSLAPTGGATGQETSGATGQDEEQEMERLMVETVLSECDPVCPESCVFPYSVSEKYCRACMRCHGIVFAENSKGASWRVRKDCLPVCKIGGLTDDCAKCHGFEKMVTKPCEDNDKVTFTRDGRIGPAPGTSGSLPGSCEKVRRKTVPGRAEYCARSAGKHCPKTCGTCDAATRNLAGAASVASSPT